MLKSHVAIKGLLVNVHDGGKISRCGLAHQPAVRTVRGPQNRLFDLRYAANLLTGEASTVVGSEAHVAKWKAEIEAIKAEMTATLEQYPLLLKSLEKFWTQPQRRPPPPPPTPAPDVAGAKAVAAPPPVRRGRVTTSNEPFMNAVYAAAQFVDGSDPQFTWLVYKPGEARDFPVLPHGNVATPGEIVPRHFPNVLAKGDGLLKNGSGRLDLAEKIFTDAAPLAARVMVNRVWGWHFGRPLVATPSDYLRTPKRSTRSTRSCGA